MVITNDEAVWKQAVMWHDVIGGLRNNFPAEDIIWGVNFRMPELLAAVALAQLRRLDGLLDAMRARKRMLKAGLAEVVQARGIGFREMVDPDGDAAIALVMFLPDAARAEAVATALRAENIGAGVLYHPDHSDYHIYRHWTPIMEQRTWTADGGPWRWAQRDIRYTPDMCPRPLDLLGRGASGHQPAADERGCGGNAGRPDLGAGAGLTGGASILSGTRRTCSIRTLASRRMTGDCRTYQLRAVGHSSSTVIQTTDIFLALRDTDANH